MDKRQGKGEKSNFQIGKEFEEKALKYFRKKGIELERQYKIEIGLDCKKKHKFDLWNNDTIVECKAMKWTKTENNPAAKMASWNEAMYYFFLAPKKYKKIFFAKRHYSPKRKKTLLEYYIETFAHLIPNDVILYDYDTDNNLCEDKTNMKKSALIKNSKILHSQDETIIKEANINNDYTHNLWKNIILKLSSNPIEIQTMGKEYWFSAHLKDDIIYIDNSQINKPSVELSTLRKINENGFSKVYHYYQPWRKGDIQRQSMPGKNTSYILALINHFEKL